MRSASPEEAASILEAASSVIIVPGYGLAVAQAQHKIRELYDALTRRGVDVKFGIHPGRAVFALVRIFPTKTAVAEKDRLA